MSTILSSTHPLLLALSIIVLSFPVAVFLAFIVSIWTALALILVFLGGIIVIFSYITTVAREDKITFSLTNIFNSGLLAILVLTISRLLLNLYSENFVGTLYSLSRGRILIFLTVYLLITLLAIVKITQAHKGSLITWQ